jgi:hypothetical protein
MDVHANATLGLAGRLALAEGDSPGMSQKAAAVASCVSRRPPPLVASRRQRFGGEVHLRAWLLDRPCRPGTSPRVLDELTQERTCECRRRTGWGPRLVGPCDPTAALDGLESAPPPGPRATSRQVVFEPKRAILA